MTTHWHERWNEDRIGFHKDAPNENLIRHLDHLPKGRVLLPLAGKSEDLWYLRDQAFKPTGVELVEKAVLEFFSDRSLSPQKLEGERYVAEGVTMVCCDIFDFEAKPFQAIWDRAAMIALPEDVRPRYAQKLIDLLAPAGTLLLCTIDYVGPKDVGPPFSVPDEEVHGYFKAHGTLELLDKHEVALGERLTKEVAHESVHRFVKAA